ncbi:peptidoglycan recognition protein-like [Acanthaster planci]|uniref:Peptidoglycan recognition protein-like n=1 Tax=Acanthaster planci TaxID=133434 RepID=A0A8B7YUN9_ACAPL|nr:peptidoglycan recognition protein-like [Acanthaster planci]
MAFQSRLSVTVLLCLCVANTCTTFTLVGVPHPRSRLPKLSLLKFLKPCVGLSVVSRDEWNARSPWDSPVMKGPKHVVVVRHTATSPCNTSQSCEELMQNIQNYHMDSKGWNDIGYNFVIGGDGRVYEGRGWETVVPHTSEISYDPRIVVIALIGNYTDSPRSLGMVNVLKQLFTCGVEKAQLTENLVICGQRDAYSELVDWPNDLGWCSVVDRSFF